MSAASQEREDETEQGVDDEYAVVYFHHHHVAKPHHMGWRDATGIGLIFLALALAFFAIVLGCIDEVKMLVGLFA
jgi:hypothetical protein